MRRGALEDRLIRLDPPAPDAAWDFAREWGQPASGQRNVLVLEPGFYRLDGPMPRLENVVIRGASSPPVIRVGAMLADKMAGRVGFENLIVEVDSSNRGDVIGLLPGEVGRVEFTGVRINARNARLAIDGPRQSLTVSTSRLFGVGLVAERGARILVDRCLVESGGSAVRVMWGGVATLSRSALAGSTGLVVGDGALASLSDVTIAWSLRGVEVSGRGATAELERTSVIGCRHIGVRASEGALLTLAASTVSACQGGGIELDSTVGRVDISDSTIDLNGRFGLRVNAFGSSRQGEVPVELRRCCIAANVFEYTTPGSDITGGPMGDVVLPPGFSLSEVEDVQHTPWTAVAKAESPSEYITRRQATIESDIDPVRTHRWEAAP